MNTIGILIILGMIGTGYFQRKKSWGAIIENSLFLMAIASFIFFCLGHLFMGKEALVNYIINHFSDYLLWHLCWFVSFWEGFIVGKINISSELTIEDLKRRKE